MLKKPHLTLGKSLPKRSRPQVVHAASRSFSICTAEAAEIDWNAGKNVTVEKAPALPFQIFCHASLD